MRHNHPLKLSALLIVLLLVPLTGCAENAHRRPQEAQGPPPEAISACKDKQEGDSVTFQGRRGESLNGTCTMIEGTLAAVPEGHKQ